MKFLQFDGYVDKFTINLAQLAEKEGKQELLLKNKINALLGKNTCQRTIHFNSGKTTILRSYIQYITPQ